MLIWGILYHNPIWLHQSGFIDTGVTTDTLYYIVVAIACQLLRGDRPQGRLAIG
ncbi:MAG: hypothetical protein AB4352_26405 [Hormoscilla sp.]